MFQRFIVVLALCAFVSAENLGEKVSEEEKTTTPNEGATFAPKSSSVDSQRNFGARIFGFGDPTPATNGMSIVRSESAPSGSMSIIRSESSVPIQQSSVYSYSNSQPSQSDIQSSFEPSSSSSLQSNSQPSFSSSFQSNSQPPFSSSFQSNSQPSFSGRFQSNSQPLGGLYGQVLNDDSYLLPNDQLYNKYPSQLPPYFQEVPTSYLSSSYSLSKPNTPYWLNSQSYDPYSGLSNRYSGSWVPSQDYSSSPFYNLLNAFQKQFLTSYPKFWGGFGQPKTSSQSYPQTFKPYGLSGICY